jgi:RIP metalloprotease RseP
MKSPDLVAEAADPEAAAPGHPTFSPWRLVAVVVGFIALGLWQGLGLMIMIGGVLVMIYLHELGHYVMAKRAGMKVTEFFIGFGPRIWSFRRGEVEYGLKAIPAGAYVRIIGMTNLDEVPPEEEHRTYRQKSYPQRLGVAVAGSAVHFALAVVLLFVLFAAIGPVRATDWQVREVTPGSAAAAAGIRSGDRIVAVDGVAVSTFEDMTREVRRRPGAEVPVTVERDGRRLELAVRLGAKATVIGTVGEDLSFGARDGVVRINSVIPGGRAEKAGLRDGDEVTAVNGVPLGGLEPLEGAVARSEDGEVALEVRRDEGTRTVTVDLGTAVATQPARGFLGVGQELTREPVGVVAAATGSVRDLFGSIGQSIVGIGKVFNLSNLAAFASDTVTNADQPEPTVPTPAADTQAQSMERAVARPVSIIGIVDIGSNLSDVGAFLELFARINIVIGVINLIPLLPFDGGHVAVATYEKIRELGRRDGKRYFVDAAKLLPATYVVVAVMVTVGLLAGYSDIVRPIQL